MEELAYLGEDDLGDLAPNELRRCFLEAHDAGNEAELTKYEPTARPDMLRRLIYRTDTDGTIQVFIHEGPE